MRKKKGMKLKLKKNKIRAECYAIIAHKLGKISWCLLTLQIGTLMLSITLLSIYIINLKN